MIAYFDTSAIVPLLIREPGTEAARSAWVHADHLVSVRLTEVEARAAIASATRAGRIAPRQSQTTKDALEGLLGQLDFLAVNEELIRDAGGLAESQALRAYDAIHLAAARRVGDSEVVLVAGDGALLKAAQEVGIATASVG